MTIQFPIRAKFSLWALLALSCNAHATQQIPIVGQAVERIAGHPSQATNVSIGMNANTHSAPVESTIDVTTKGTSTAKAEVISSGSNKTWNILPSDGRLATTLERWAKSEGMRLIWDAQRHVMLSSSDSFVGSLSEALQRVLSSPAIRHSDYPLEACIYPNNPPVLRITRLTEQAQECPQ
jgi:Toxin co-regulated pilus biosynthesis protein Q